MSKDPTKITRKQLHDAVKHLRRLRRTENDRLEEKQLTELNNTIQQLEQAGGTRHGFFAWFGWLLSWPFLQLSHLLGYTNPEPSSAKYTGPFNPTTARSVLARAESLYSRLMPHCPSPTLREWTDVILVAAVVAVGVRSYYLQPFKIPTNSMFPTLRGVVVTPLPEDATPPPQPLRLAHQLLFGRNYYELTLPANSRLESLRQSGAWLFQRLHFKFTHPEGEIRWTITTEMTERDFLGSPLLGMINHPAPRSLRFQVDTGDHLFVNKILYHFRSPARGDSFVFRTLNLDTDGNGQPVRDPLQGSQFYIKRLVATGGDTISVLPPQLLIDGQPAPEHTIRRVWEAAGPGHPEHNPAYRGYAPGLPEHRMRYLTAERPTYTLPLNTYWAMGDNSYNSLDSRLFGPVPRQNVVGKAAIIYYPLNRFLKTIE
jgi:signal peptidase I